MKQVLKKYKEELEAELEDILRYWTDHAIDKKAGGFVGRISSNNKVDPSAPKGAVLNSRILWSFSAAYRLTKNDEYLAKAERACSYILQHFYDRELGGVYWTVAGDGHPHDTKKQIYALAFAVYGFSEYYRVSADQTALASAIALYNDIVKYSYDKTYGGYYEAFTRDWKKLNDTRLSEKDANECKSMNTHLHLLEAFANLYQIWPDDGLKKKLSELVRIFQYRIICNNTHHLILFFENDWKPKSKLISYGHDIEAAWLVQEAAEVLGDQLLPVDAKSCSAAVAKAAAKGLDEDGGMWYEYDPGSHQLVRQKHWWPQAEAMVGFFNTWQNTGDQKWLELSLNSWEFVKSSIRDKTGGEWWWGINEDNSPMTKEDKVGLWKCPYHNSRACIEIIQRINSLSN